MHPQAAAALAEWNTGPSVVDPEFDILERRRLGRLAGMAETKEPVAAVEDIDANAVPCRLHLASEGAPVILHLHGGGFVWNDLESHDAHARRLSNRSGWSVLSVDYRLAPEHPFPAASDDVDSVVEWLKDNGAAHGLDTTRMAVLGDSAGGHLALVAAWRHPGLFTQMVLVYPCVDPRGAHPSYRELTGGLTAEEMDWFWDAYVPPGARDAPEMRLVEGDLSGFPRTLLLTAEFDPLVDEGEDLAQRLAEAGVPTVGTRYLGMIHGFYRLPDYFDASEQALRQIAGFLRSEAPSPTVAAS